MTPENAAGPAQLEELFARIVSSLVGITFIAAFAILVWGGFKYIMSGGEPKALAAAKQTIVWALLGILFIILAWLSIQLIAAFTGINALRTFNLKILS